MKKSFTLHSSTFLRGTIAGFTLYVLILLSLSVSIVLAQEDTSDLEDIQEGFDDEEEMMDEDDIMSGFDDEMDDATEATETGERFWDVTGSIKMSPSVNFIHDAPEAEEADYRGLTRLRLALQLDLDLRLTGSWKALISGSGFHDFAYLIKGRDEFTDAVLDTYEQELEFREVYLQGSLLRNLDLKFGRQIVNWGRADNSRVLDVLNPLDLREPGMVDIEDLRLPVTMTRLDYLFGNWNLTGITIHEIRFNKEPAFGSEFFPFDEPPPEADIPKESLKNTEYAAALSGVGVLRGVDVSFHFARFFDDQPHIEGEKDSMRRHHSRLTMIGTSASAVKGSWLLKTELAYFDGLAFNRVEKQKSRFDALIGVEYSGLANTTITIDATNRHLIDFEKAMANPPNSAVENEFQYALTYRSNFRRETIHIVAVVLVGGGFGDQGALERFSITYDWTDALSFMVGTVLYQSGDNPIFQEVADNDRFFFEGKYSF